MASPDVHPSHRIAAAGSFAAALVLYLATLSRFAVPGESTEYLVHHLGLSSFPPMTHVVWGWLVQALDLAGTHPLAWLPNLFSAFCGAGVVLFVFLLTARLAFNVEFEIDASRIRVLAGLAAAGCAAVSTPLWTAANRAHPYSFGLLLLLASLWFLVRYRDGARPADLYVFGLVYAVAAAEFETCLLLAPCIAVYVVLLMKRNGHLQPRKLLSLTACGLVTPLVYFVAAWHYALAAAAGWREFESFWQIYKFFPREQIAEIGRTLPRQGWLVLLICAILPWIACMYLNRRGGSLEGGAGSYALHAIMLALALVVLFHGPVPAWIAEPGAPLLVTPAAMAATCFGYASGYLCAVLTRRLQKRDVAGAAPEWITASFAAVAIIAAGAANAPRVDTSGARELQALARAALDNAAGRGVLATDGLMDYPLMIEARDAGRPLAVFNVAPRRADAAYLRYVASLMDTPRLKGLAMVGLLPMLMEWMDSGSGVEQRLAMQTRPDYWLSAGYSVVPRGLAYLGARRLDGLDATQLLAEHQTFWDRFTPHLDALALKPWPAPDLAAILRARVSRVANDLGVLLENVGHPLEAETAYARAIVFNGANRIARANLMDLCVRSGATNRAALLARRLAVAARRGDTPPLRLEIELHGHARTKAAYDALHVADEAAPEWPQELSDAVELFNSGKLAEARSLVDAAVQAQPGLDAAWVLQAVVADAQDDVTTVQAVFTHMRATRKQWPQLLVIMARRALAREDYLSARDYLEEVAVLWPSNAAVLDELVRVYLREGSKRYIGWAVQNLLLIDPESAVGNYAAGRMLEERKEFLLAEDAYRRVRPSSVYPSAQARLALLLAERTEWEAADGAASRAVELEPGLADAWEAVAVVRAGQGRHDEAAEARQQMVELDPKRDEARQDQE